MRWLHSLSVLPILTSASPVLNIETIHKDAAPIISSIHSETIPDSYMIKLKDHVDQNDFLEHHAWVLATHTKSEERKLSKRSQYTFLDEAFTGVKHTYQIAGGFFGYSGHFDEDVIEEIRRHPFVEYIEKDSIVHTMEGEIENSAPWGLARISHRDGLSFGTFNKYVHTPEGGEGVDVYVIDTGTYVDHVDFEGRASWGKTIPQNDVDEDGNGHGTHCSGTIAGKKYGVAKKAHIKAVKVLGSNGSGSMSDVVKGVEFAAESHLKELKAAKDGKKKGFKGSSANMSLGGGKSTLLDKAVNAAVDAGIHFAVAAGNDNADSCNFSPAAAEKAVTVGASTLADERAYFSNFGPCNDIFAPGLNIESTWIGSKHAINTISGTSMASPHIAGLLAYLLSLQPAKDSEYAVADISPKHLKADLISIATVGALSDVPEDTINILAWNGGGSSNYSKIIEDGGYDAKHSSPIELPELKDDIDHLVHHIHDSAKDKMESTSHRIQSLAEELEEAFEGAFEEAAEKASQKFASFADEQFEEFQEL